MFDRLIQFYARTPNHPAKLRIFDWLRSALTGKRRLRLHVADSFTMNLDPDDLVDRALVFRDAHEELTTAFIQDNLHSGNTALIAGSHIGYHVLQAAKTIGPSGRVLACEPDPASLALAWEHVKMNGFADRVALFGFGLAASPGLACLGAPPAGNSGGTALLPSSPAAAGLHVPTTTITDLLALQNLSDIDLLLLDVEGAESAALAGMGSHRPRLVILESDPRHHALAGQPQEAFFASVRALGYRLCSLDGSPVAAPGFYPEANLVAVRADQPEPRWPIRPA